MLSRTTIVCLLLAGCGGADARFGVDLFVDSQQVTDRDRITQLVVHVDGSEHYDTTLDLTGVADKTTMTLHYVPLVRQGTLSFNTEARAQDGSAVAVGASSAVMLVDGGSVEARVQLQVGAHRQVGEACTSASDLCDGAGGCIDGVCCGMPCNGACLACNVTGAEGVCVPVGGGTTPMKGHAACEMESESSCGRDGTCDGAGNCRKWPLGTTCGAPTCNAGTNLSVSEGQCDGNGTCVTPQSLPCDPYRCKDATQCYGSCTDAAQCTGSPPTCNTALTPGSCGPKSNGAVCTQDAECQTMHCVEKDAMGNGVCCDTTCATTCTSCKIAATRGKCTLVPAGQDPRAQCPAAMGAQAACIPGGCDGNTATCKLAPATTQCRAQACTGGMQAAKTNCMSDGTCPVAATTPCDPYVCGATACKASCTVDTDCQTGGCLNNKCATYGGAYVANTSPPCGNACQNTNPFAASTCGCPGSFPLGSTIGSYNDCAGPAQAASTIAICQRAMRTTKSDWGGAFATYAVGCGVNTTNPYTAAATCPADTVASVFSHWQSPCNKTSTITFCTSTTAPTTTYGGAYQEDDDVGGGAFCRVANPKTSACTCPAGTNPTILRLLVDRTPLTPGIIGSQIKICVP
jgi:hypothetical protein